MIRQLLRHFSICLHVNSNIDLSKASPLAYSCGDLLVWEVFKHFSYTHGQKFCWAMKDWGVSFLFVLADGRTYEYVV